MGKSNVAADSYLDGYISHARIWNGVALSASEVATTAALTPVEATWLCLGAIDFQRCSDPAMGLGALPSPPPRSGPGAQCGALPDATPLSLDSVGSFMMKLIVKKVMILKNKMAKDNNNLGKFHLDDISDASHSSPQFEATIDFNKNDILNVYISDKSHGKNNPINIAYKKVNQGMTAEDEFEKVQKRMEGVVDYIEMKSYRAVSASPILMRSVEVAGEAASTAIQRQIGIVHAVSLYGQSGRDCCDMLCSGFSCPHGYESISTAYSTVGSTRTVCCVQSCNSWSSNSPDSAGLYLNGLASLSSEWKDEYTFIRVEWMGFDSSTGDYDTQYIHDTGLSNWVQSAGGAWLCLSYTNGPAEEAAWAILPISNAAWDLGCSGTSDMGRGAYYYAGDCCASANSGWVGIKNRNAQKKTPVTDVTINTGTCTIPWGAVPKISPPSHAWQFKVSSCTNPFLGDSVDDISASALQSGSCTIADGFRLDGYSSHISINIYSLFK
ncbi:unnamed protein product [Polarella glacialis]|uniref:Uncharacterized protein n=1 Tax=Polarella glacialis TaxID=89957 RepID=A0A813F7G6_POLGL|nr:unnamed protein product [Polarella glacialis]